MKYDTNRGGKYRHKARKVALTPERRAEWLRLAEQRCGKQIQRGQ